MNTAFWRMAGRNVIQSACLMVSLYAVSFIAAYGNERGKIAAREGYYANFGYADIVTTTTMKF